MYIIHITTPACKNNILLKAMRNVQFLKHFVYVNLSVFIVNLCHCLLKHGHLWT